MTNLRTAAQQALEALEAFMHDSPRPYDAMRGQAAMGALKAALAEPPKPASLKRGTTGRCTRKVCECEKEGLGLECIHLEPVVDGYPLWSGIPKAEPVQEPALNSAPGYCKHCKQYTIEEPLPAEPVQEPVAFVNAAHLQGLTLGLYGYAEIYTAESARRIPLYTAPPASVSEAPQRKPLTEDEIFAIENDIPDDVISDRAWTICFARAVEAAHGIKEGT